MTAPADQTIIYRGRRYDVSRWREIHPGGGILDKFLGQDATCVLHMAHDMRHKGIQKMLKKMDLGPVEDPPPRPFDLDYIELETMFYERGWFDASMAWYAYKTVALLALLVAAFLLPGAWLKGLFFGLFIQQSAFIAHDVCHDAVVPRRWRRLASWFYGTVCFGLSHEKWVREHNIHHMINGRPFEDPQMNTMPDLIYAHRELEAFERRKRRTITDWERTKMGFQHIWMLPVVLLYGRILVVLRDLRPALKTRDWHHLSAYAVHSSLWVLLLIQGSRESPTFAAVFIPVVLVVSGIIHLQLVLSHVYAPRLFEDEQRHWGMQLQAISNQNITTTWIDDWFHGGLQHHIEHHLFPRLPRHSLPKVRPYVRALCEKHGLPYRSDPFFSAVIDLLRSLYRAGAPLRADLANKRRMGNASS